MLVMDITSGQLWTALAEGVYVLSASVKNHKPAVALGCLHVVP